MNRLKTSIIGAAVLLLLAAAVSSRVAVSRSTRTLPAAQAAVTNQTTMQTRAARPPTGQANVASNVDEVQCEVDDEVTSCSPPNVCFPQEAPTAFNDETNDLVDQTQHDADRATFEVRDDIAKGLGPVYNAQSCAECHQNPVTGAISQVNELRAGRLVPRLCRIPCGGPTFSDAPGGSLIQHRAIDPRLQERVPPLFSAGIEKGGEITTARTSLNTMGDGFVEAISNETLVAIAAAQPDDTVSGNLVAGQAIAVPIEEADPEAAIRCRIGRFGHKDQHASLLSFSGDAYLNEMGITNRLFLAENTSLGRDVSAFDPIPNDATIDCDPSPSPAPPGQNAKCGEDPERDIDAFTQFMRATKAPARDATIAATEDAQAGDTLFHQVGCAVCHVDTITTAMPGTTINAGTFVVPQALGNKVIHPFGDFLLHDIGTGDGIVQNGGQETRLKVRTAPLWGVRTRTLLMHDALSLTFMDAILRHSGEAEVVRQNFENLTPEEQTQVIVFLESL
ncbi:MAG: di-heme oxidoredictase family protein [Pyrinomonadaceae bacterium]